MQLAVAGFALTLWTAGAQTPPDPAELARLGVQNSARATQAPASWTTAINGSKGALETVKTSQHRDGRTSLLYTTVDGRTARHCEIYECDGLWHVREGKIGAQTKPYEAIFETPGMYYFLSLSKLRFITNEVLLEGATFEALHDNVPAYRVPDPQSVRSALETILTNLQTASLRDPSLLERPDAVSLVRMIEERLQKGAPFRIDGKTGMIVEVQTGIGPTEATIITKDFRWLDEAETNRLNLPEVEHWEDRRDPLSSEDLEECVMVVHDPLYREADRESSRPDGCLLNLKNGRLRRLPYRGFASIPCCFMRDRRFVIVIGIDVDNPKGLRRLVKLDLLTGANEEIVTDAAPGWTPLLAKISPDDRWLISQYTQQVRSSSDFQMNLIDLTSGKLQQLGKTGDFGGALSWLPDGDAGIVRRFLTANEPSIICRLGKDGTQKDIRVGDMPLVLPKSTKILYRNEESALWYTCNLDGTAPHLYAGGMKSCGNPAASPDGERVIFDFGGGGKATKPMLFEFGKTNGTPITSAKGFTGHAVW